MYEKRGMSDESTGVCIPYPYPPPPRAAVTAAAAAAAAANGAIHPQTARQPSKYYAPISAFSYLVTGKLLRRCLKKLMYAMQAHVSRARGFSIAPILSDVTPEKDIILLLARKSPCIWPQEDS